MHTTSWNSIHTSQYSGFRQFTRYTYYARYTHFTHCTHYIHTHTQTHTRARTHTHTHTHTQRHGHGRNTTKNNHTRRKSKHATTANKKDSLISGSVVLVQCFGWRAQGLSFGVCAVVRSSGTTKSSVFAGFLFGELI